MAAITTGKAMGAAAATHQHGGRFTQLELVGHPACSQVGAITEPALAAATAAAEVMHPSRQPQGLRPRGGVRGFTDHRSARPMRPDRSLGRVSCKASSDAAGAVPRCSLVAGTFSAGTRNPTSPMQGYLLLSGAILGLLGDWEGAAGYGQLPLGLPPRPQRSGEPRWHHSHWPGNHCAYWLSAGTGTGTQAGPNPGTKGVICS